MKIILAQGNIASYIDKDWADSTFVNAANPYLNSSENNSGVNKAFFVELGRPFEDACKDYIKEDKVQHGNAVCNTINHSNREIKMINAVSPIFKYGDEQEYKLLRNCYKKIFELAENQKTKKLYLPILGAGSFNHKNIKFESLFKIAYSESHNYFHNLKKTKGEDKYWHLEEIILVIFKECDYNVARKIECKNLDKQFEKKILERTACEAQCQYIKTVYFREQFLIAKWLRILILALQFATIGFWVKYFSGKKSWNCRRQTLETLPLLKMIFAVIFYSVNTQSPNIAILVIGIYLIFDTLLFLLGLVFLTDILKPSTGSSRSAIMLLINYIELLFMFGLLHTAIGGFGWTGLNISVSINFGLKYCESLVSQSILVLQTIVMAFFNLVILGYILSALVPRRFLRN